MSNVANLVLPFFGLILLGFVVAQFIRHEKAAMGWLSTFIIYLALPALFFKLLSKTPIEELTSWDFILTNITATFSIFAVAFSIAYFICRTSIPSATIQGLVGAYGNIGYMGPGLVILTFGETAAVPLALIFCFENIMHFTITPTMMALSGEKKEKIKPLIISILHSIIFHPFIIATFFGIGAAIFKFSPPVPIERLIDYLAQAAAPSALFAMGVTLALSSTKRAPIEITYLIPIKLLLHPLVMYLLLSWVGDFEESWVFTAVLLAALPTATNVFVFAQQYGFWIERSSACILITTILSVLSVSCLLLAITTNQIPSDLFPNS